MEISTQLSDYTKDYKGFAQLIKSRFEERGWSALGERKDITPSDVEKIIEMSY